MKESALLEELQQLAAQHHITVSSANLKKYSYYIESGMCKVEGQYRIIIDRHLHLSEKIDVLIDALQELGLDTTGMSPELHKLFTRRAVAQRAGLVPQSAVSPDA